MANNKMTGIIFSNSHDDALGGLTARRSMGSVPFASRYRLIDLVLSRMSHAGVDSVALVMQNNYHSLMEHIGSGKEWDLSRKRGGIAYFPPYSSAGSAGYSRGTLESMTGLLGYLQSSSADYIAVPMSWSITLRIKQALPLSARSTGTARSWFPPERTAACWKPPAAAKAT